MKLLFKMFSLIRIKHKLSLHLNRLMTMKSLECSNALSQLSVKKINIKEAFQLQPNNEQQYCIEGWIRSLRDHRNIIFMDIDDGSSPKKLQMIINENLYKNLNFKPSLGSSIKVSGHIIESSGPKQSIEFQCDTINLIGECNSNEFPFDYRGKLQKTEDIRKFLHLRMRLKLFASILRLRSELMNAIHIYMKQNDFVNVTVPLITGNDCEGGGHVFTLKSPYDCEKPYFNKDVYLTVSGQLHLESVACAMSKVYSLSQTFRAERTAMKSRHLNEFIMYEAEEAFVNSLDEVMDRVETIVKFLAHYAISQCRDDLDIIHNKTKYHHFDKILNSKYIRITYSEACDIINKSDKCPQLKHGDNLNNTHEKFLIELFNYNPLFVTHFPANVKPFYMKRQNENALCFDLLSPICGELCGGSLREDDYHQLKERISQFESPQNFQWYLDLRRFGNVPHGGFGIGFDRLIQTFTGISNIRDVTPFPRWHSHCYL